MGNTLVEVGAAQRSGTRRRASGRSRGCERPGDAPGRQLRARHLPLFHLGELVSANEHLEKALAVFDLRQPLPWELELCRVNSFGYLYFGLFWTWLSRSCLGDIARDAGGGSAVFRSLRFGRDFLLCGINNLVRGDGTGAQKHAEEAMALTEAFGFQSLSASATTFMAPL